MMKLTLIVLILVCGISSQHLFALSGSIQLNSSNLNDRAYTFSVTVITQDSGFGKQFEIIVTPKKGRLSRYLSASLTLSDESNFLASCEIAKSSLPAKSLSIGKSTRTNAVVYAFTVTSKCLEYSKFQIEDIPEGNDGEPIPSIQTYWFYLKDILQKK